MKKQEISIYTIIITLMLIFGLFGCSYEDPNHYVKLSENNEKPDNVINSFSEFVKETHGHKVSTIDFQHEGMNYLIFYQSDGFDFSEIEVVNLTKEKLEIELLELQIEKLRGY